ncbi:hypothetical protein PM082_000668 [Marasmius tenuissimus]|nr:hypothetical protein PM082_000668 [Marasmius tenuissimus]
MGNCCDLQSTGFVFWWVSEPQIFVLVGGELYECSELRQVNTESTYQIPRISVLIAACTWACQANALSRFFRVQGDFICPIPHERHSALYDSPA